MKPLTRYTDFRACLSNALFNQGRREEASAQFREALRINPSDADSRNNLGVALGINKATAQ
jgi:Flp pilus assembly protein TadD